MDPAETPAAIEFGRFRILPHRRELLAEGRSVELGGRAFDVLMALIRRAEELMEQDPPLVPVAWENILDVWYNYVKGHNPKDYFGIYDVVRFDTFWLDKA